ncbi:MAG: phosphoribosylamine--glycine ligase [Candidatus Marinimicrobia bacterium]|nr:phosphoribosylamine--glycine ligase [Candidatus Neomarinimicrobiota bacterium]
MKVLVVGSGGREHSIVWKLSQSPLVEKIYTASGNGGTRIHGENIPIDSDDIDSLVDFAKKNEIDLTVVGPELPLVKGIVDRFSESGLKIFGPTQKAAMLEGSKVFAKIFMKKYDIPTSDFVIVKNKEEALEIIKNKKYPYVIKVDGLAAGKGAFIIFSDEDCNNAISQIWDQKVFDEAANKVIIEEYLDGEEVSVFAVCDGERYVLLPSAQDHKRVYDNDKGPNTGGMGAYSPSPLATENILKKVEEKIIKPLLKGMIKEGIPYKGVLYCGLMVLDDEPFVLEFNCRFGDPEAQVILPLIESDFAELISKAVDGRFEDLTFNLSDKYAVCVVLASQGYPGSYRKGFKIYGLKELANIKDGYIFHAATRYENGEYLTNGGRVLGVTALDVTLKDAIEKAYKLVEKIHFEGMHYRKDIGVKGLKRLGVI